MSDERVSKIGMQPPHPGDFIRTEILDELHLSIARAAEILGVRRATLSDLVHGKVSLSPAMALRIEKAFDVSMDVLLRMQAWTRQRLFRYVGPSKVTVTPCHGPGRIE